MSGDFLQTVGLTIRRYSRSAHDHAAFFKHFGWSDFCFRYAHFQKLKKYNANLFAPDAKSDKKYKSWLAPNEGWFDEHYILLLREGTTPAPYARGIIATRIREYAAAQPDHRLPELVYPDERTADGRFRFKADWAPETFAFWNYIGRDLILSKETAERLWPGQNKETVQKRWRELSAREIRDIIAGIAADGGAICHVPEPVLWNTRPVEETRPEKPDAKAFLSTQKTLPKVSILIPNKDHADLLRRCIDSITTRSTYPNYEIVVLENNSTEEATFAYYKTLAADSRISVRTLVTDWNYSHINNAGAGFCSGDYLLFLNNDTEVISGDFLEQMLYFALRDGIAAVGAKLLFADGTIQHAGVTFGVRGVAGHAFHGWDGNAAGYENRICSPQDLSAVTAACMLVRKRIFEEVGGFDENLRVAFNDIDLCMRMRRAGYRIVYTPFAELYHYESKSRGTDEQTPEKRRRFDEESMYFQRRWCRQILLGDPYYNPNLSTDSDDFEPVSKYRNR